MKPNTNMLLSCDTIAELVDVWQQHDGTMAEYYSVIWDHITEKNTVVEFGTRRAESTVAFLHASACVLSYEFNLPDKHVPLYRHIQKLAAGRWGLVYGDTRSLAIPSCDVLLIDSQHSYEQVAAELRPEVVGCVRRAIMIHDTIAHRDVGQHGLPGIWPAIEEFLEADYGRDFQIVHHANHGVGFTVLSR